MVMREIINIDEELCTGCGECIPNCPEGALQIIDEKARLVSDLFCDGLGACVGHCPTDAMTVEKRDCEPYEERTVMENIVKAGPNTVKAHLLHLKDHGAHEYFQEAIAYLRENGMDIPEGVIPQPHPPASGADGRPPIPCACPGSAEQDFRDKDQCVEEGGTAEVVGKIESQLRQWPIQMHLISPNAPYYQGADVLLAADCVAFAIGGFHRDFLKGKSLAIACPKLDAGQDMYVEKIKSWFEDAKINTLTVLMMQVPCCGGLLRLAEEAAKRSSRKVPIKYIIVNLQGEILKEEWLST